MKRHFLAAIASIVMIPICGRAQDFESNGLYYSVISADEVEITSEPRPMPMCCTQVWCIYRRQ